jgi:flagellar P-ring protein precursor FlgI
MLLMMTVLTGARSAQAVKIADITRIGGGQTNVLTGLGLVYGLKGTGDGGDFLPAMRPLQSMMSKFSDAASVEELNKVQNVAVVSLTATIPRNGIRQGDKLDVYLTSLGAATSLKGGRLFICPMQGPRPVSAQAPYFALSQGSVTIEDVSTPTVGIVKGGCVMEISFEPKFVDNGRFKLILEDPAASWTNASVIAKTVNGAESENGETIAFTVDPKEVDVNIPMAERERPDGFISRVLQLAIPMIATEARVQINEKTGTLIVTGDVEISPVVISQQGLTISTITPPPVATPQSPIVKRHDVIGVDTSTPPEGNAKLQDLINALDQLKVPVADKITIVKELYKTGKLHAKLEPE